MKALRLTAVISFSLAAAPAAAGEFIAPHEGRVADYALSACERPPAPDVSVDLTLDGAARRAATNEGTRRFNVYVEAVNAYFDCMVKEAKNDLGGYEAAVTRRLDEEEKALFDKVEALRQTLIAEGR